MPYQLPAGIYIRKSDALATGGPRNLTATIAGQQAA